MADGALAEAPSRRGFINWFLGTSAGALLLSVAYPLARYLVPPPATESAAASVTLAINPGDVKPNSGQIFKFGSRPGILIRTPAGELRAFSAVCTHLNCTVQYRSDLRQIWCACHNGYYDLAGRNVAGPPPRPLDAWDVHVANGEVVVTRKA
jgi:Rieske Fe-S protein